MNGDERGMLAAAWWRELTTADVRPGADTSVEQLVEMVARLADALTTDPLPTRVATEVGAQLAVAGWHDPTVPAVSAHVLHRIVRWAHRPDAEPRFAALMAALGQGHQDRMERMRRSADEAMERRYQVMVHNASVGMAIADVDGTILEVNHHLADQFAFSRERLRGMSMYDLGPPDEGAEVRRLVEQTLLPARAGSIRQERRTVDADGRVGWASFVVTYVKGAGGLPDCLLAVGDDVTEIHHLTEELRWQARHDPLTGLPNRRHLLEHLAAATQQCAEDDTLGLCFADLDCFKNINDRYGHSIGDRVLIEVAARMRTAVRDQGCFLARIGGDEFVGVIAPCGVDEAHIATVVERLTGALNEPIRIDGHRVRVSASLGAVVAPVADAGPEDLLDAADRGMYQAKSTSDKSGTMPITILSRTGTVGGRH